ncbi:hypothetical protein BC828DRAFT_408441 [Blastocladiella britannica]|nr:hypothetical protein BC828DRAFT_408441 [Blastocladiella britannica]
MPPYPSSRRGGSSSGGAGSSSRASSTFGLVPSSSSSSRGLNTRAPPRNQHRHGGPVSDLNADSAAATLEQAAASELRLAEITRRDELDSKFGFDRYDHGPPRSGWLVNMHATLLRDDEWPGGRSACDFYFLMDDGATFKATITYSPYFLLMCRPGAEADVEEYLKRKYETLIEKIEWEYKEDLDMPNHLLGLKQTVLKLQFRNVQDLLRVRKDMLVAIKRQRPRDADVPMYDSSMNVQLGNAFGSTTSASKPSSSGGRFASSAAGSDPLAYILDIREYDVPYYIRVAIDCDLRVGLWYMVTADAGQIVIEPQPDKLMPPDPVIFAYDIETTKLPLKFPDASHDQVMMISYMIDGQGYLITNREIVSQDIDDFEYTPKPEFEGPFVVFNEPDEGAVLRRFFDHIIDVKPNVIVTYNGDFFDWPFVDARATANGINMQDEIGWFKDENDEYKSYYAHHSDAFRWVKRDSYLPAGSHGLKAVTAAKLKYNPTELDPELMLPYAQDNPHELAKYSVSDAVATYYLYMKYVHPFVFSLCNIIPMNPDEVLRKGSGTLCESLLMVKAFKAGVLMPNKHIDPVGTYHEGHLLTSESYVGGHVEALEAGVFRADIPTAFKVDPDTVATLIEDLDRALEFTVRAEFQMDPAEIVNLAEVRAEICAKLEALRAEPNRTEEPLIYHLDVAAMYPNIILTNRLQPDAMVEAVDCAACDYNDPGNGCKRDLEWRWRGEYFPATRGDTNRVRTQLHKEPAFLALKPDMQQAAFLKRMAEFSRKNYKRIHETTIETKTSTVCQRENPFYIDTVQQFRDRRYEYKAKLKEWKGKLSTAEAQGDTGGVAEGKKMVVVMDSLQLAHKCILNSFYGYVMRKGSRWYSMEMGGIVCHTGAKIIQLARELVEQVGRPLELDTDGIWCILPKAFPEEFTLKTRKGKKVTMSYPCTMLNHLVHDRFTNHQYQSRNGPTEWTTRAENSIFFEVDGPYRAMILPSSTEADKLLKKRYAVFNQDGSLAELKGFELKRRGELKLIKVFQQQIFSEFLAGSTLAECYAEVAKVANGWLDIMDDKGKAMADAELIDLISENKNMSKALSEYDGQKSAAITTAKRLAEFLGAEMVKDKLACHFLITRQPLGAPVAERALPVAILSAEQAVRTHFLRKWFRDPSVLDPDIRDLIDWEYYKERFGSVLQKIITIPAAMQGVTNPIPRVPHPDWLRQRVDNARLQKKLTDMFDIEDMRQAATHQRTAEAARAVPAAARVAKVTRAPRRKTPEMELVELADALRDVTVPNPREDFGEWLKHQKTKWRYQRLANRLGPSALLSGGGGGAGGSTALVGARPGGGFHMDAFLQQQQQHLESTVWQVVQVQPSGRGGTHTVWAMVCDKLHSIQIPIPRRVIINSHVEIPSVDIGNATLTPVKRTLPRGVPACPYLYELAVDEDVYIAHQSQFEQLFAHPTIEGVYETQVTGTFRAMAELGCLWTVNRRRQADAIASGNVKWSELQRATAGPAYLATAADTLGDALLYHVSKGDRHMVVLFSFSGKFDCQVFLAEPSGAANMGRLDALYDEFRGQHIDLELPFVEFQVTAFRTERQLVEALNKYVKALAQRRLGPMMITMQSSKLSMLAFIKSLALFPSSVRPCVSRDTDDMPALGWQAWVTKRWLKQVGTFKAWRSHTLAVSQLARVPIGNLGLDCELTALDVMFARRLTATDHVLWYSKGARPDLGGRECDEHYSVLDATVQLPEVNSPGYYPRVSVELAVHGLCVTAIYGLAEAQLELLPLVDLIKVELCPPGSTVDPVADRLMEQIYRWLTSPAACLFDPHATFVVFTQMKRVFMGMVAALTELKASVVYASFSRLLIMTPKSTMSQAIAFSEFASAHLIQRESCNSLSLQPVTWWRPLLWMDMFNHGGYHVYPGPSTNDDAFMDDHQVDDPSLTWSEGRLVEHQFMMWNVAEYLPEEMAVALRSILEQYLTDCHGYWRSPGHLADLAAAASTAPPPPSAGTAAIVAHSVPSGEIRFKSQLLRTTITPYLLRILPQFQRKEHGVNRVQFPAIPGALTNMPWAMATASFAAAAAAAAVSSSSASGAPTSGDATIKSPTLELIKYLTTILGLDATVEDAVRVVRRNALDLLKVREFAPEAQFTSPCLPIVVPLVICPGCQYTRDLDLTRDRATVGGGGGGWACPDCETAYNGSEIEAKLVELVESALLAHQVQDLVCTKCKMVQRENLGMHCTCAGAFALGPATASPAAFFARLEVIADLAAVHGMELLKEIVGFTLDICRRRHRVA